MDKMIQIITLTLMAGYILFTLDNLLWDAFCLLRNFFKSFPMLSVSKLNKKPPKLIAVVINTDKEEDIVRDVVENILDSQVYPRSMYHIFLGVRANNKLTIEEAKKLEAEYDNVHLVVDKKTDVIKKSKLLNYVISQIKRFEKEKKWRFAAIAVHDIKDIIHPYEFLVTNHLIDTHPVLQFPVFPLMRKPTLSNFIKNITVNTYADEFAENHFIAMVNRSKSGGFVPSIGTGLSLSRRTVDSYGYEVFPEDSVLEGFSFSLNLYNDGVQIYQVMEKLERVNSEGKVVRDYIATRTIFPSKMKPAITNKSKSILGITMEPTTLKDVLDSDVSAIGKYTIYRDLKMKMENIFFPVGSFMLIYYLIGWILDSPTKLSLGSVPMYLFALMVLIMVEGQMVRGLSLYKVYGLKTMFYGVLFPPLIPVRMLWGYFINFIATIKAYKNHSKGDIIEEVICEDEFEGIDKNRMRRVFKDKTIFYNYHRKLGDALIERGYMTPQRVNYFLRRKDEERMLGEFLIDEGVITEHQLINALSAIETIPLLKDEKFTSYDLVEVADIIPRDMLEKYKVLPLLVKGNSLVIACTFENYNKLDGILQDVHYDFMPILTRENVVDYGIESMYGLKLRKRHILYAEMINGVNLEQIILIKNYAVKLSISEKEIAKTMGLIPA